MSKKKKPDISRSEAMRSKPSKLPVIGVQDFGKNELRVRVRLRHRRWIKWLGGPSDYERSFVLDRFGREVYESCDGRTKVEDIVEKFSAKHKVSTAEAEISVTTFLKTLISKGLIAVPVVRES